MEGRGGRIPRVYDRKKRNKNVSDQSAGSAQLKNTKLPNGSPVVPRVRQLLPTVHQGLFQGIPTFDRTHEKGNKDEMGVDGGSGKSVQRTKNPFHHGPNPSALRCNKTGHHRNRRIGFHHRSNPVATGWGESPSFGSLPLQEIPAIGNQLRDLRQRTTGCGGCVPTLETILRRSDAPSLSLFGSPELGILHYNKGAKSTSGALGTGPGRYRLQDLLPSRRPKWKTRRAVQAFGVPPRNGGVENQPIATILGKNHFEKRLSQSFLVSSARLASLPTKKWNEEFAKKVQEAARKDPVYQQAWISEKEAILGNPGSKVRKGKKEGTLEIRDDLLYRNGRLWVKGDSTIQEILKSEHDTKVAGHMGQDKTTELIRRKFWWPKMNE